MAKKQTKIVSGHKGSRKNSGKLFGSKGSSKGGGMKR